MAKIYMRKIMRSDGDYTIDDVPDRWKEEVQALLDGDTQEGSTDGK